MVAAAVAQHVSVNLKGEAGALADTLDQAINGVGSEWPAPFGGEHVAALGILAL